MKTYRTMKDKINKINREEGISYKKSFTLLLYWVHHNLIEF